MYNQVPDTVELKHSKDQPYGTDPAASSHAWAHFIVSPVYIYFDAAFVTVLVQVHHSLDHEGRPLSFWLQQASRF